MSDLVIERIDLEPKLKDLSAYYTLGSRLRTNVMYYAQKHNRLYFITGGCYLFYTDNNFETINPVAEINTYYDTTIMNTSYQNIAGIVESVDGTLIIIGKDYRKTSPTSPTDYNATEQGVIWRKPISSSTFTRTIVKTTAWSLPDNCTVASGYFGSSYAKMIAFTNYTKILYYSIDDGLNWLELDMSAYAYLHIHAVYLPKRVYKPQPARIWFTIGDDWTGAKAGIFYADTLDGSNNITNIVQAYAERPGYRLVALTGTARKMFFGNESGAGGIMSISNDTYSITNKLFEYTLGRNRLDFHQFNALLATDDGVLLAATDSYPALSTPHKSHGGYVYISNNEGATFIEIPLLEIFDIAQATYDGSNFWIIGATQISEPNMFSMMVYKIPKPSPYDTLRTPYIVKSPIVDINNTIKAKLKAGEYSLFVDLADYKSIVMSVETLESGILRLQASPFRTDPNWTDQGDITGWHDVMTIKFNGAERKDITLPKEITHNRLFRVYNPSASELKMKHCMFIAQD
jgi:hypothetical protein